MFYSKCIQYRNAKTTIILSSQVWGFLNLALRVSYTLRQYLILAEPFSHVANLNENTCQCLISEK